MKRYFMLSFTLGILFVVGSIGATRLRTLPDRVLHDCTPTMRHQDFAVSGPAKISCWREGHSVIELAGPTQPVWIKFSNPNGKILRFTVQTDGQAALQISSSKGITLSPGFIAPSITEGLAPASATLRIEPGDEVILLQKNGPGVARVFDLTVENAPSPLVQKIEHLSRARIPWFAICIFALAVGTLIFLYPVASRVSFIKTQWTYWLGVLISAYTALYFIEGLPFLTSLGNYDPFDDKSYLEWAHQIGFGHSLDISSGVSAAAKQNVHSWGTGLVLSPPFFLAKILLPNGTGLEPVAFTLLTTWSVFLGLATLCIYYYGFSLVFDSWIAALIAFATLAGTSLAKWTFGRLLFSHAAEALSLALGTLFFIKIYLKNKPTVLNYIGLAFSCWLTVQIRRENILVTAIPLFFELRRFFIQKQKLIGLVFLLSTLLLAVATLQYTNVFTQLKYFWAEVPTAGIIAFDMTRFKKNFWSVLFDPSVGFFTMGVFVPLSLLAFTFLRHKLSLLIPFMIVICGYLLMCMLHEYPSGCEWQNRFLLKVNPIVFGGIGLLLHRSHRYLRAVFVSIILFGLYHQHNLYLANLHPDQAVFADLYPDLIFTNPFAFRPERFLLWPIRTLFIISATFVLSVLGFLAYKTKQYPAKKGTTDLNCSPSQHSASIP